MKVIAIDIGSTHIKSALLDSEKNTIAHRKTHNAPPNRSEMPLCYELDPEALYQIILRTVLDLLPQADGNRVGLRFSTQMHGFLFAGPDGLPLTPYISWRDNRCLTAWDGCTGLQRLAQALSPQRMEPCGLSLKPGLALCNAYTLIGRGDYKLPPDSRFCTLGSYLIGRLCGHHACHITNAAATGLCNVREGVWDKGLVELAGLGGFSFPEIRKENQVCTSFSAGGKEILLYPDVGDQQTAVLGSLMRPEKDVNLNIATAGQLSRIEENFTPGEYEARPYFGGRFLNTVTRLPAGRDLDVFIAFLQQTGLELFGVDADVGTLYRRLHTLSAQENAGGLRMNLGFFQDALDGTGGGILEIREGNLTPANLFAASLSSMADTYGRHLKKLETRSRPERLVLTGGFLQKEPALASSISQKTGLPVYFPPYEDEIMAGHFRLLLLDAGVCKALDDTAEEFSLRFPTKGPENGTRIP